MQIEVDNEFRAEIIQRIHDREFAVREGVHCTDLLYCLNKQAMRRYMPLPPDEHSTLLFSLGWATQRWLTGSNKDDETITLDGIQVSPDATYADRPWELKCTYTGAERPIDAAWIRQIMCQCKARGVTDARLTRFELLGNWKSIFGKKVKDADGVVLYDEKTLPENQKPTLGAYHLIFTQDELDDNWAWVVSRRGLFVKILDTHKLDPPSLVLPNVADPWECGYCPKQYKELCNV